MSPTNMSPTNEKQWLRLRALRVERAQQTLIEATRLRDEAAAAVQERQTRIHQARRALQQLDRAKVHEWASHMPRWSGTVSQHRARLFEHLERDEYALIDDERSLEQAQEAVHRCRADLSRALGRESAVQTLVTASRVSRFTARENTVERDLEDRRADDKRFAVSPRRGSRRA